MATLTISGPYYGVTNTDTWRTDHPITSGYLSVGPMEPIVKKEKAMRGLFEVFIVDPKTSAVVFEKKIVADDEGKARLKAAVDMSAERDVDLDDYDIIVRRIGDVRAKKQVQEVKVVPA